MSFILANNRKVMLVLVLLLIGWFLYSGVLVKGTHNNLSSRSNEASYPAFKAQTLPKVEKAQKKEAPVQVEKDNLRKQSSNPVSLAKASQAKPANAEKPEDGNIITIPKPPHEPIIIGE